MNDLMLSVAVKTMNAVKSAESKIFTKRNTQAFFMLFALGLMFVVPETILAAGNPLEEMRNIYIEQAQTNAFPVIILWTLVLGVVISFAMGKFMPFILAVVASVIIAVTPEIAPNFTYTEFNTTP